MFLADMVLIALESALAAGLKVAGIPWVTRLPLD